MLAMQIARALVMAIMVAIGVCAGLSAPARAQTLTTFTSEASYTAALPTGGVTTTVEGFGSVAFDRPVSTGVPDQWSGFTLVAQGTTPFGNSNYCASLRTCMNWTPSPPASPGVYGAVSDPSQGNGRFTFVPAARAFGFGLEYWDWNDGSQRSQLVVTLSNGAVFNVTGPTTATGAAGGFVGFRIDQTSVNSGITISSVAWVALSGNAEIIGLRNVRVSAVNPLVVTNTNDSGTGSLRAAIQFANTQATTSTVSFAIAGAGPHTITLSSVLPDLTANGLTIDGTSQSGTQCRDLWAGSGHDLRISVRGSSGFDGFRLGGTGQTIRGLAITGFDQAVRLLSTSNTATVHCNYLGLLPNGTGSANNRGVWASGASARIGGLAAGEGNVISANNVAGVVTIAGSTDTAIRGNFIGTDPTGLIARANGTAINNFNGNATWRDITRNLIAGNNGNAGIALESDDRISPSTDRVRIQRNRIGFNRTLTALLRNGGDGIAFLEGSITNVLIGGMASTEGNEITGAADALDLRQITNITIQGNTIARAVGRGIWLNNVSNATIGGTQSGLGNIIGGNGTDGIRADAGSSGITINGNQIGAVTITDGTFENQGRGIFMENTSNVVIGDGTAGGRNVIARNGNRAIMGVASNAGITINGNYVGTNDAGTAGVVNGWNAPGVLGDAISFDQGGSFSNLTVRNNVIGGYGAAQLELWNSTGTGITIQGNNIGVGADGVSPIVSGNIEDLIYIGGGGTYSNLLIGGTPPGTGNLLARGGRHGINLDTGGTNIQVIGNTIRNNAGNGVLLINPTRAAIIANRIFSNGLLGIDLGSDGVTANDPGDGDSGANDLLNFPAAIRAVVTNASTLGYSFTLDAPAAADGYRIEFFANTAADASGFGEGERFLGHVDIVHPGGARTYTGSLSTLVPIAIGDIISATTTRRTSGGAWDITSEFSAVATADGVAQLAVEITSEVFNPPVDNPFATPGNDIILTANVSNTGTGSTDTDSIFVVLAISPRTAFYNAVTPQFGGVVGFTTGSPSLTFTPGTDLRFSNAATAPASFAQCTYTPASGYDPQVRYVCFNQKGSLPPGGTQGRFTVQLRTRIE